MVFRKTGIARHFPFLLALVPLLLPAVSLPACGLLVNVGDLSTGSSIPDAGNQVSAPANGAGDAGVDAATANALAAPSGNGDASADPGGSGPGGASSVDAALEAAATTATDAAAGASARQDAAVQGGADGEGGGDGNIPDAVVTTTDAAGMDLSRADTSISVLGDGGSDDAGADALDAPTCTATQQSAGTLRENAGVAVNACSFDSAAIKSFSVAVDTQTFMGSDSCGACVLLQTSAGSLTAHIVGLVGSSPGASATFAIDPAGMAILVPGASSAYYYGVTWGFTACPGTAAIAFTFQAGSNPAYSAIMVRNAKYPVVKAEYLVGSTFVPLEPTNYNFWVAPLGMGVGPFTIRLTDMYGHVVVQTGVSLTPQLTFQGTVQFPSCSTPLAPPVKGRL